MAEKKNQHFVPASLLREFSCDKNRRSINMITGRDGNLIKNSSIKNQASSDYFYHTDVKYEDKLGKIESYFFGTIKKIKECKTIELQDHLILCFGLSLQYGRTPHMMELLINSINNEVRELINNDDLLIDKIKCLAPGVPIKAIIGSINVERNRDFERYVIQQSVFLSFLLSPLLIDLKKVILVNKTNIPFIISDNPIVISNGFFQENTFISAMRFSRAGFQMMLPLDPFHALMLFDQEAYSIKEGTFIDVNDDIDVEEINNLQMINSYKCVYFSGDVDDHQASNISHAMRSIFEQKIDNRCRNINYIQRGLNISIISKRNNTKLFHCDSPESPVRDLIWKEIVEDAVRDIGDDDEYFEKFIPYAGRHRNAHMVGEWIERI